MMGSDLKKNLFRYFNAVYKHLKRNLRIHNKDECVLIIDNYANNSVYEVKKKGQVIRLRLAQSLDLFKT